MNIATRIIGPGPGAYGQPKDSWTAFWGDPVQSRCVADAPDIWQSLSGHWSSFAISLNSGARVLDLGCGRGAVAHELLAARGEVHVTGIDFARLPLTIYPQVELLSDTPMESLPFAERSFNAVVSQFGFEYSHIAETAREMSRVLAPDGRFSLLVHHSESSIVSTNRSRLNALVTFLGLPVSAAFCSGDAAGFSGQMSALLAAHPHDSLIAELARSLPSRLRRSQRERVAIWNAIEDALAPERCLAECLNTCCVAPAELDEWLEPVRAVCELEPVAILREPNGVPIAWRILGTRSQGTTDQSS